jgi:hypothetical protein
VVEEARSSGDDIEIWGKNAAAALLLGSTGGGAVARKTKKKSKGQRGVVRGKSLSDAPLPYLTSPTRRKWDRILRASHTQWPCTTHINQSTRSHTEGHRVELVP